MQNNNDNPVREGWILCLILGLVMINFPFIHIFSTEQSIFGIPELVLYFFIGWPLSIGVIWLFSKTLGLKSDGSINSNENNRP